VPLNQIVNSQAILKMSLRSPFERKKLENSRPLTPRTRSSTRNKFENSSSRTPNSQQGTKLNSTRHRPSNSFGPSVAFSAFAPDHLKKVTKEEQVKKNPRNSNILNNKPGLSQGLVGNRVFTPKSIGE
jgi:hypothetical protein